MLPTFSDNPSPRFNRQNPAWGWGWPCCCGAAVANVMVVIGFQRISVPDSVVAGTATIGNEQTIAAFDGDTGAALWYYDLGFRTAGRPYWPGRILIDNSGNVYVTSIDALGGNQVNILNKFDKTGSLLWQYDPGPSTPGGFNGLNGMCFDSSGNVIFGIHNSDAVNFNYALKVNPAGVLVTTYSTHGTGFPLGLDDGNLTTGTGIGITGAPGSIVVDAGDNVYWVAPVNRTQIISVDPAGNFRYSYTPTATFGTIGINRTGAFCGDMLCDKVNSKLFLQRASSVLLDGSTRYAELTPILTKLDISGAGTIGPTVDWSFTFDDFVGGTSGLLSMLPADTKMRSSGISNSLISGGLGYDSAILRCFFPGGLLSDSNTPRGVVEHWASCQSGASPNVGFLSKEGTLVAEGYFGIAQCCDPTSGMVFAILEQVRPLSGTDLTLAPALRRLDPTSGIEIWTALNISGMSPLSIAANTYT